MPRFMTIWLPRWPVQRRLIERPELRKSPVFVCRRERRGVLTVASWAWAEPRRAAGAGGRVEIRTGMSLAEAMAVLALAHGSRSCHVAEIEPDDPAADRAALEELARWCRRFSPLVGIETVDAAPGLSVGEPAGHPDCIHLDVGGTAGFFGGEAALARTAVWTLAARGLHARVAIADTVSAAHAVARHVDLIDAPWCGPAERRATVLRPSRKRRFAVVPAGAWPLPAGGKTGGSEASVGWLGALPVTVLRLDAATVAALHEVGITSLDGIHRLSPRSLAARFPPLLGRRLAQFTGAVPEPLVPLAGRELPQAAHAFDVPVATSDAFAVAEPAAAADGLLGRLVTRCVAPLAARGEGVLALQVRLERPNIDPTASGAPVVIDVRLFRPTGSVRHLVDLVHLRLGRSRPPRELTGIAVEVVAAGPAACRQRSLFTAPADGGGGAEPAAVQLGMLLDRLSGRLGRAAVFVPRPVADAQPEHAWIAAPPEEPGSRPRARPAADDPGRRAGEGRPRRREPPRAGPPPLVAAAGRRPIWMPPRPLRLDPLRAGLVAVAPDGPPVRFRLGDRVHRVSAAHGPERIETAWWRGPTVRRDYYVVETESGERFWMFRRLRDGGWFLHGVFA